VIDSLRGTVEAVSDEGVLLRVGPVVLHVLTPPYFLGRLREGQSLDMPVHLHVQMEGNRAVPIMVGFPDVSDREFFRRFISVSGIGVRGAARALAAPVEKVGSAIAGGDLEFLTTLRGVGRSRAKRIVAELQDEMKKEFTVAGIEMDRTAVAEAAAVLMQLGIGASESRRLASAAVSEADDPDNASELVRLAMRLRSGS
jgi:Holliday junction DNA helicase RuvA